MVVTESYAYPSSDSCVGLCGTRSARSIRRLGRTCARVLAMEDIHTWPWARGWSEVLLPTAAKSILLLGGERESSTTGAQDPRRTNRRTPKSVVSPRTTGEAAEADNASRWSERRPHREGFMRSRFPSSRGE